MNPTKLYTFVVHYLQIRMKEYGCCPKFKRRDNSTYTFTKMGVVYLVSATPPKPLIGFFMKLYTFVVHYLQMCMKGAPEGLGSSCSTKANYKCFWRAEVRRKKNQFE
jgi:hypothetical protein